MLTILVTAIFVINACVVLHPLKLAPGGVAFVLSLSKTFTKVLGEWAMTLYLVGSFAVIYSTMATLYDGYARLIDNSIKIITPAVKFCDDHKGMVVTLYRLLHLMRKTKEGLECRQYTPRVRTDIKLYQGSLTGECADDE